MLWRLLVVRSTCGYISLIEEQEAHAISHPRSTPTRFSRAIASNRDILTVVDRIQAVLVLVLKNERCTQEIHANTKELRAVTVGEAF
jgi:hypothetical protein